MHGMNHWPLGVMRNGKDELSDPPLELRAGPLTLILEQGDLRYVRYGDWEILRRVYVAVRDRRWDTIPARLSDLRIERGADSFRVTYLARHQRDEIDFEWRATISGDARGEITFAMDGAALSTFWRNRIGICVLHPIRECAGRDCVVESDDGSLVRGTFPTHIAPHQPFVNIRALSHEVAPGVAAEVRFAGDVFETEDQRNWSDGSFKTYSTPLALPFPVEVARGTTVKQSVTLGVTDQSGVARESGAAKTVNFTIGPASEFRLPRIGLCSAGQDVDDQSLGETELARLKNLRLAHLRVDLALDAQGWEKKLRRAAAEARALSVDLEIALTVSDRADEELTRLVGVLDTIEEVGVAAWLVFHRAEKVTAQRWIDLARRKLHDHSRTNLVGGGTNNYFTELNREPPPLSARLDFVAYSVNPQVHAFDDRSLVENLAAQAETVRSARRLLPGVPIAVGPVTLKPRFNPNAVQSAIEPLSGELPPQVDARQMSLFGAAWTLGSLKYLGESGVAGATYFEVAGWRGVMERAAGSPLPRLFPSRPGQVFPLYHVLADAGEFAGGEVITSRSDDPLTVDGFAVRRDGVTRLLVANLSAQKQSVAIHHLADRVLVKTLDETTVEEAALDPETFRARPGRAEQTSAGSLTLDLLPFAVVRIDEASLRKDEGGGMSDESESVLGTV